MVNGYLPKTLDEALSIRAQHAVIPYAGGTDLMVQTPEAPCYLFIGKLPELREIRIDGDLLRIGAAVTFTQALHSDLIPALMKEAISRIAAPAIRNHGTFGGNLGNGSAKADSVLIHVVADAKIRLLSQSGERIVPVSEFYRGRKQLDLRSDELIVEILLPRCGWDNYAYTKVGGREALAISRVSFAGLVTIEEGRIRRFAVGFGAVADTVLRFPQLEAMLLGKTREEARNLREDMMQAYGDALALTDGRVSATYRKTVCMNLLRDFLIEKGI